MSEINSNTKHTPARRGRGGGRSRGRKNYASEGDALTEMPTPASFPATPMKSNHASPAPVSQQPNSRSTNRKNQKKPPRQSNFSDSPAPAAPSQRTPPPTDAAPSALPYAGSSSFHSPAPNTLPRPAFAKFTKSETFASTSEAQFSRVRAESVTVQGTKELSPPPSDSELPSPSQRIQKELSPCDFLFEAEKEKIRRANSANAASRLDGPFSAPPGPQHFGLNDNPIPFALTSRPAQRGITENVGIPGARPQTFGKPIHESFSPVRSSQPQHLSPQPRPLQATQPYMHYHSPQAAPVQAPRPYAQHHSPQATPPHAAQNHNFATPPHVDKSEQVKMMLGLSTSTSQHSGSAPMPGGSNGLPTASSGSVATGYPHLRGGSTGVPMGSPSSGGLDSRKILAEDALRKVLGLNLTLSMSSGMDGNRSPHGHYPGQA
ncbi:hypothetical protein N0V93_005695 [Gnomoniopsis smithogilvyi]|uniref:Proteophosphoglycan 5 n=1 Tax=Gnomoniopsis smithogilvyi TaxID=1191159 RepID=A0A9W9CYA5_9PEZI|nr:hypothetical protein N0V93_005695 [Gnomoniopsis smithogilvyi]